MEQIIKQANFQPESNSRFIYIRNFFSLIRVKNWHAR
jgi:hypothetical protein